MQGQNFDLKLCPSCNAYQDANKKDCPNCGFDLTKVAILKKVKRNNFSSYTTSIIIGIILFVVGLVAIIMRGEITVKIVGRGQIVHDFFGGGGSTESTLIGIVVISSIAMIVGLILFIMGLMKTASNK